MSTKFPTINTDGISEEQKATADFQFVYRGMLAQLQQPGFVTALCTHEAAHLFYFNLIGNTSYDATSASIRYDPQRREYVGNLAAVKLRDLRPWQKGKFWEWFDCVARAHAAGGVVGRKLSPLSDGGDQDDRERFVRLCERLNSDPTISIAAEEQWRMAQEAVAKDLENPEMWSVIQQWAEALRFELGL